MFTARDCAILSCMLLAGWTNNLGALTGVALAHSDIVLMSAHFPFEPRLVRFDSGLETYSVTTGPTSGNFSGITILNGEVLITSFNHSEIQRFSLDGMYLGPFAALDFPQFLESDSGGNVYATSPHAPVTRFNSSGARTGTFGAIDPQGIDADALGNVYVASRSERAIQKFAPGGTLLSSTPVIGGSFTLFDLAVDEEGQRLFVAGRVSSTGGGAIKIFDISGSEPSFVGDFVTFPTAFIEGVHFAAESGNILATSRDPISFDPKGLEFSEEATLLREYRPAGIATGPVWDITTFVPESSAMALMVLAMMGAGFNVRSWRSVR